MGARAEILARIRAARMPPVHAPRSRAAAETARIDLPERFAEELVAVAATFARVENEGELAAHLAERLRSWNAERVVAWRSDLLERCRAETSLADIGLRWTTPQGADEARRGEWRRACLDADVGITEVDHALADTGTLVVRAGADRPQLASLLPPTHVAVVRTERLLPDLGALVRALEADRDATSSCLTLITGPSRTADIEKKIVLGVHGPANLHVVLLG